MFNPKMSFTKENRTLLNLELKYSTGLFLQKNISSQHSEINVRVINYIPTKPKAVGWIIHKFPNLTNLN